MILHSIVIPAYNEQEVIQDTFQRLEQLFPDNDQSRYEFIFVNDGSRDATGMLLDLQSRKDRRFKALHLSRNFGHQIALTAGIGAARGATVSVIDADLQDPPEVIHKFIELWKQGNEVVYGVRERRHGESRLKLWSAAVFYRVIRGFSKVDLPLDAGDFRLMDRKVVDAYLQCSEQHRYFRGLVSWVGFRQAGYPYVRQPRLKGETKYPFWKMVRFATDGFTSFTFWPLKLASYFGFATAFAALIGIAFIIRGKMLNQTIQGWASVMVVTFVLASAQLFALGMIGEYLGRVYDEVRGRPLYFVARRSGFDEN
jgi:glycosyltransferase involved in cell wall biosynthesis